jgi:hypothetical protein
MRLLKSHDKFNSPVGIIYDAEIIANTIHTLMKGAFPNQGHIVIIVV